MKFETIAIAESLWSVDGHDGVKLSFSMAKFYLVGSQVHLGGPVDEKVLQRARDLGTRIHDSECLEEQNA